MAELRCTVATPTRELFSGKIAYASVPGADGSYGVLPGHELLVATNSRGILTLWLDAEGKEKREFVIYDGAAQVFNNIVTVLGSFGIEKSEIDVAEVRKTAEELRQRVEELSKEGADAQDQAELGTTQANLNWCELQLQYADGSTK